MPMNSMPKNMRVHTSGKLVVRSTSSSEIRKKLSHQRRALEPKPNWDYKSAPAKESNRSKYLRTLSDLEFKGT